MAKGWFISGLLTGLIISPVILAYLDQLASKTNSQFALPSPLAVPVDAGMITPGRTPIY